MYNSLAARKSLPSETSIYLLCNCLIHRTLHSADRDKDYTLIYELSKGKYWQLQFVSYFTYLLAAYWIYLAPDVLVSFFEHETLNSQAALNLLSLLISTFIIPMAIQYVRKQLVLKAYHNKAADAYKLVTQKATLRQQTEHVVRKDIKRVIWSEKRKTDRPIQAKFQVKGKKYIMYAPYFKLPVDYNHIMGFTPKKM